MKKLKNLIKLSASVRVLIPSTISINKNFDNSQEVDDALSFFSQAFGGATSFVALGAWQSQNLGLIKEKVVAVESFCDQSELEERIDDVVNFCEQLKKRLDQEAISLFVNNELYFI
ncbi:MAG: DUF3574 domain-containing protein [Pelagibacterales bacterium]|nr:DUF3574 domain-containing protein [Pelagibacterales bacterium]